MLFNSYEFILLFLPITYLGYIAVLRTSSKKLTLAFLGVASLLFYGWWNPYYLILIIISLVVNYSLGIQLQNTNSGTLKKNFLLFVGVLVNLGFLGYYKYSGFAVAIFNDLTNLNIHWTNLVLPLGISFFTFQQLTFLVDSAAKRVKHSGFLQYLVFVTFFPQLIAGPIVHHKEMMPQFQNMDLDVKVDNLNVGMMLFVMGLFSKCILADSIAVYVTPIFDKATMSEVSFLESWIAGVGFTLQIYFDFAGYSTMALGAARFFGIVLPMNFNSPLKASNIIDFWNRWHITLTRFLTSYLFTPMSINATRKSLARMRKTKQPKPVREFLASLAGPTLVTMFLSGLWHGAGYQYLVWGVLHGFYLTVNHGWRMFVVKKIKDKERYYKLFRPMGVSITLLSVFFAMIFFRAVDLEVAMSMLRSMLGGNGITIPEGIFVHLGPFKDIVVGLGVSPDSTSGSLITYGVVYCVSLLFIALYFPNSLDIMAKFKPAIDYSTKINAQNHLLFNNKISRAMVWEPNIFWAILCGTGLAVGIMSLQSLSVFLYWQF